MIRIILNLIGIGVLAVPVFVGGVMFAWAFPKIFFWCVVGYLAIGIFMTVLLEQTPDRDNGWLWTTLLWPRFM